MEVSNIGRKMEMRSSSSSLSSIISLPLLHQNNDLKKFSLHAAMIIAPKKSTVLFSSCISTSSSSLSSIISPPLQHNRNMDKFSPLHPMSSPRKSTFLSRCIKNNTAAVTSESWDDMVLGSDTGPVVVVFCSDLCLCCKMTGLVFKSNLLMSIYGRWCGHTRVAQRTINELAEDYIGRVKFFVIDTDTYPGIAKTYGVSKTLPAVVVFKDGEKREAVSWMSPDELYDAIERVLAL